MYVFTEISDVTAGKGEDMNTSDIVIQPHITPSYTYIYVPYVNEM